MSDPGGTPEADAPLAAILGSVPAAVLVTRADDGRVLIMNGRAEQLFGTTAADLNPTGTQELWADLGQRAEMLARLEREGSVDAFPARMRHPDGRHVDVLISAQPIEIHGEPCLISITYDISSRIAAEDALRRSERRLRQISETIDEGFVLVSFSPFRVHYASPTYVEITGMGIEQIDTDEPGLLGRIEPEDHPVVAAAVNRMRAGLRSDEIVVRLNRRGEQRWVRFRWSVVEHQPGTMVAAVVEDVTERRRADAELRRARTRAEVANQATSALLSRVGHELRGPLDVIEGAGRLLAGDDLGPAAREAAAEVVGAGRDLRHLLEDLEVSEVATGAAVAGAREPAPPGRTGRRTRRVLYVEDDESNAELARRALGALPDVELVVTRRGREALELVASSTFDLVLLDLHLPDVGGEEILGRIRSDPATAPLPVVIVSAEASPEVTCRLRAAGADDYLTKPVSVPHLVQVVDRETGVRADRGVLDRAVLDDLAVLEEVEPGTLAEVVGLFARAGAERVDAMAAAVQADERSVVAGLAHALRGSGANLGAVALAEACRILEHDAGDDAHDLGDQVTAVREAFAVAVARLREHVAPPGG